MTSLQCPTRNEWWEATKIFASGLAIATFVHTFVAEIRYIPSESMTPTLQVGDRLIIEKLSYRVHPPERGDIVVFRATEDLQARNLKTDMIKRVIGLPGDTVSVRSGQVYLNGRALAESYLQAPASYDYGPVRVPAGEYFLLGDNRNHSYDSHLWGFVPRSHLVGRATIKFYPVTAWTNF